MDIRELLKKWNDVLNEGADISNLNVRKSTAIMLENEHKHQHMLIQRIHLIQQPVTQQVVFSTKLRCLWFVELFLSW
jgi:hypothetical protein